MHIMCYNPRGGWDTHIYTHTHVFGVQWWYILISLNGKLFLIFQLCNSFASCHDFPLPPKPNRNNTISNKCPSHLTYIIGVQTYPPSLLKFLKNSYMLSPDKSGIRAQFCAAGSLTSLSGASASHAQDFKSLKSIYST